MTYTLTAAQLSDLRVDASLVAVQSVTITGKPTGGTFTLAYNGQTTAAIAFDADATAVESALQALSTIGIGAATVTGASKGPFTVYIDGGQTIALIAVASFTGGTTPSVQINVHVAYSDARLNRNFDRAEGDYEAAVVYTLRQMLADAHKIPVYTVGVDSLNKQKIFDNLEILLERWERIAGLSGARLSAGTISLGIDENDPDFLEDFQL